MLTKDSVTVSVDAVVYYRVSNATVSVANVENAHHSTRCTQTCTDASSLLETNTATSNTTHRLLAQTSLRNILGTKNLHEILSDRDSISNSMQVHTTTNNVFQLVELARVIHLFIYFFILQIILDEATTAWGIKVERVEM